MTATEQDKALIQNMTETLFTEWLEAFDGSDGEVLDRFVEHSGLPKSSPIAAMFAGFVGGFQSGIEFYKTVFENEK